MNGIDPVAIATGQDWRAIEAGAHAWAARDGQYRSLTTWKVIDGVLHGSIEMPMQVGTVGGTLKTHPTVAANLKILGNPRARELAGVMVGVGLAQNLGALRRSLLKASRGVTCGCMRATWRQTSGHKETRSMPSSTCCAIRRVLRRRSRRCLGPYSRMTHTAFAPGKLILMGEHAVVYGHPGWPSPSTAA